MNRIQYIILIIILGVGILGCAKIGSPYGGPKDETPPTVIKTKPSQNSVQFIPQKKIVITFDEYIQLENIFQEMIISPPLKENVNAVLKGKELVIEFPEDAVFDTTTYTLNFGMAIKDNNEGNVLKNYQYVFSLKDYLDTMNIEGKIVNAFNHKPDEERMYVMLYRNLADSAPMLEKPRYITRTDEAGNFSIFNLEAGSYRIFALKDGNSNMLFDMPEEQIAFSDSAIQLTPERFEDNVIIQDSTLYAQVDAQDSIIKDSITADTLGKSEKTYLFHTELLFFKQDIKNQYLTNNLRSRNDQLFFSFSQSLTDSVSLKPLNYLPESEQWYLLDKNKSSDTLIFWIRDTSMIAKDSLTMELCYPVYDSTLNQIFRCDTFIMTVQKEKTSASKGRKVREGKEEKSTKEAVVKKITLGHNIKNTAAFDLNRNIIITSPTPAFTFLPDQIKLYQVKDDTVEVPIRCNVTHDPNSFYRFIIDYQPEELTSYSLLIPENTFTDIYGITHDTIKMRFKTQAEDFYGTLTIHLSQVKSPLILQLMDEKEIVVLEKNIDSDQDIRFEYLYPKKYILKLIVDNNGNGKWDTGDYLKKIQPEKIIYYSQPIDIRSNWEMDFPWPLDY